MRVSLFTTCLADSFFQNVPKSVVGILDNYNVIVDVPENQTCCGQIAFNAGYWNDAKKAAEHFIKVFEDKEYIVIPSGSCAYMVKHHYQNLFANKIMQEKAKKIAEKTYEFTDFLVNVLGVESLNNEYETTATYHTSCQMCRGLGLKEEPLKLLENIEGLKLKELQNSEDCCGFGGTFSITYGGISASMAEEKLNKVADTDADILIGSDLGCLMNLDGFAKKNDNNLKMMHIAELLSLSMKDKQKVTNKG